MFISVEAGAVEDEVVETAAGSCCTKMMQLLKATVTAPQHRFLQLF
jgi:hypothetical protein